METFHVVGPVCESADLLGKDRWVRVRVWAGVRVWVWPWCAASRRPLGVSRLLAALLVLP